MVIRRVPENENVTFLICECYLNSGDLSYAHTTSMDPHAIKLS